MLVPRAAAADEADGAVVFRALADGRVERVSVETGLVRDGKVEITQGISAGDHIVTRGQFRLADGQPVSPRTADGKLVGAAGSASDVAEKPN